MTAQPQVPASDDPFEALEDALDVNPSPEFVARVRERVRQEPAVGAVIGWWPRLAFGAAVATAAIVLATLWIGQPRSGPTVAATRTATPAPIAEPTGAPVVEPDSISPRPTLRTPTRVAVRVQRSGILVPDDQRLALNRLLIAVREGRAVVPAEGRALEDENGRLLELRPIEIPPINIIDLLPVTPAGHSGEKDK